MAASVSECGIGFCMVLLVVVYPPFARCRRERGWGAYWHKVLAQPTSLWICTMAIRFHLVVNANAVEVKSCTKQADVSAAWNNHCFSTRFSTKCNRRHPRDINHAEFSS
jgi:hypothetical protein